MNANTSYHPNTTVSCARKSLLAALLLAGVAHVDLAQAAAVNTGDMLTINAGVTVAATAGNYSYVTGGSYFMIDANGSGTFETSERTAMQQGTQGLIIGVTQSTGTSHFNAPTGTEGGTIDAAWAFLGHTGMHFTASPVTGGTTAGLDFSGWRWTWNGIISIPWGGGVQNCGTASDGICMDGTTDVAGTINNGTGLATFSWSGVYGTGYTLDYFAIAPMDDPSGFGRVPYGLHLEGIVNAVPVPAAVWLFGSGLAGLLAMARRRKS